MANGTGWLLLYLFIFPFLPLVYVSVAVAHCISHRREKRPDLPHHHHHRRQQSRTLAALSEHSGRVWFPWRGAIDPDPDNDNDVTDPNSSTAALRVQSIEGIELADLDQAGKYKKRRRKKKKSSSSTASSWKSRRRAAAGGGGGGGVDKSHKSSWVEIEEV